MRLIQLATALLASSISVCAVAQQIEYATVVAKSDVPSKAVRYGDLDLQRHEGAAILYRRIQNAAHYVCRQPNERALQIALIVRNCASDATSRAVAQVGAPMLTTLHAQQTGLPTSTLVASSPSPR